jgi:hypothetical protein
LKALASVIASSIASRVPEPIEKCRVNGIAEQNDVLVTHFYSDLDEVNPR